MIFLEYNSIPLPSVATAAQAGRAIAREIRVYGFAEFCVTFPNDFEIEWTDTDLWLEPEDLAYFASHPVPLDFVRAVFINWRAYAEVLKNKEITEQTNERKPE